MTCGARAPSNQLDGWGAARHHCGAGHESRINQNIKSRINPSENQKDSRFGRVRIIISGRTCALLNAQQIKMVSREACVCAMWSRTGQGLHVCMRAYLRNLLGTAAHR